MKVSIEIETNENAAFHENENSMADELIRILASVENKIKVVGISEDLSCPIYDINGNRCGSIFVEEA